MDFSDTDAEFLTLIRILRRRPPLGWGSVRDRLCGAWSGRLAVTAIADVLVGGIWWAPPGYLTPLCVAAHHECRQRDLVSVPSCSDVGRLDKESAGRDTSKTLLATVE